MKNYQSLADALDDLKKRGYEADFATETDCLYCGDLDIRLDAEDFHIDEVYHFESGSSSDKSPTLYAITSSSGVRGNLIDAHGAYPANISFEMVNNL